ncbi:hypothetical protein [Curtobacterium sp. 9128]|uniref:hypothetical protein n=1 Tax=Curtobacterium sp. 9128 TaxID=1793722 RepID=UPI0011A1DA30|nr:hypothetical protein [Curtobacterium sp. 9128]
MGAVIRYVVARSLTSQRWVPPIVCFVLLSAATYAAGGDAAGTGALPALLLVPIVTWTTVTALHNDDRSQVAILAVSVGGVVRARVAVLVASALLGLVLGTVAVAAAIAVDPEHGGEVGVWRTAAALEVTVVGSVLCGVALGHLCARPVVRRIGYSWLIGVLSCVLLIAVPRSPCNHALAALSSPDPATLLPTVALDAAVEAVAAGVVLLLTVLAYRRSAP